MTGVDLEVPAHGFVPGMLGELGLVGMGLIGVFAWRMLKLWHPDRVETESGHRLVARGFVAGFGALLAYGFFHQTFEWAYFPMFTGLLVGAAHRPPIAHTHAPALP